MDGYETPRDRDLLNDWRKANDDLASHPKDANHPACAFVHQRNGCREWLLINNTLDVIERQMIDRGLPHPNNMTEEELGEAVDDREEASGFSRRWKLVTAKDVPYGFYPEYPEGPAMVQNDGWNTSLTTGGDVDGARVNAFKVVSETPYVTERHELDGKTFPSREVARKAEYEAGLIAYMVYEDSGFATVQVNDATWDAINALGADRPEGSRYGQVWEQMDPSTLESFTKDSLRWLKDRSEMTADALGEVAWTEVYRTFHGDTEEIMAEPVSEDSERERQQRIQEEMDRLEEKIQTIVLRVAVSSLKCLAKVHEVSVGDALILLEDATTCEGHESLDGAHMGETVYCDGTCR